MLDTVAALNQAAQNNVIHVRWVKGHCGIIGNERADVLVKDGAFDPLQEAVQIPIYLPASSSPSIVRDLNAGGTNTGNPVRTVTRLSNGFLPFAKRPFSNFF